MKELIPVYDIYKVVYYLGNGSHGEVIYRANDERGDYLERIIERFGISDEVAIFRANENNRDGGELVYYSLPVTITLE